MRHPISWLQGLGLGAGLMYLLDPDQGRRRRALLGDQFTHLALGLREVVESGSRDLGNRAHGVAAEAKGHFGADDADDHTVAERVRARLGHVAARPGAVRVECRNGRVTLAGRVPAHEMDLLITAAASARGVRAVEPMLEVDPDAPAAPMMASGLDALAGPWPPGAKLAAGVAGGLVLVNLLRRGGPGIATLGLLGVGLAAAGLAGQLPMDAGQGQGGGRLSGRARSMTSAQL